MDKATRIYRNAKGRTIDGPDKKTYYLETQFWYDKAKARDSLAEFHNYLVNKRPFIDVELFAEFGKVEKVFRTALDGITTGRRAHDNQLEFRYGEELQETAPAVIEGIETMIQKRLN